jgi:hypothetical protein
MMQREKEAQKLADKIIADVMNSPLNMDDCLSVISTVMVEMALTNDVEVSTLMQNINRLHDFMMRIQSNQSGVVH